MKHFILSALLSAFAISFDAAAGTNDHSLYDLANINIAKDSHQLPPESQVATGTLSIDKISQSVTLRFERQYFCAPDTACTAQMPAPVIIKLPIIHIGTGFCGGEIITAEVDSRSTAGQYTSITIFNDNGNGCEPNGSDKAFAKPVGVEFTEQEAKAAQPTISTMEGIVKSTL